MTTPTTRRTALGLLAAGTAAATLPALATPAAAEQTARTRGRAGTVTVRDIELPGPDGRPVPAYLVLPGRARPRSAAAVLFLHWFDPPAVDSDRTEFLTEAVTLARRGVVSLLPQLTFPWAVDPVGDATDVRRIEAERAALRGALDRLAGRPEVERGRLAVVGHDYGAMHGALLAAADRRVTALAALAADATWEHWFLNYWLGYEGPRAEAYARLFAGVQPVDAVARVAADRPVLLQFAGQDQYIDAATRARFTAAAPAATVELYQRAGHDLALADGLAALTARTAWLSRVLRLPA